jgi:opacity protein-like surface antigen
MKLAKLLCGVALGGLLASNAYAADLLYSDPGPRAVVYNGGAYFGGKIGANWMNDATLDVDADGTPNDSVNFDTGITGSFVAGYAFGGRWGSLSPRIETEIGYLANDVSSVDLGGPPAFPGLPANGEVNAAYGLVNLLLDIPMSGFGFTPFIGGGIGIAHVNFDNVNEGPGTTPEFNDGDTAFAWNLTAGLSYDISRNVTFDVAYRFLQFNSVSVVGLDPPFITSTDDINNHQVTFGARVHI